MDNNYSEFKKIMEEALKTIDLELSEDKIEKLYIYYSDILETNKTLNLTAITEMKEFIYKHFIDSLSIIKIKEDIPSENYKVIDIGTGAGFPGIPLAIVFSNLDLVLLDSLRKRLNFIDTVIKKLSLSNVSLIHGRAEDYARDKKYREQFDLAVSRAVANLSTLSELCVPFIKKEAYFISYKSEKAEEEIKKAERAFSLLKLNIEKKESFIIEADFSNRTLLLIKKNENTSMKYPRKAGVPAKEPL